MKTPQATGSRVQIRCRQPERWSPAYARTVLGAHQQSGLTLSAFARREGLPLHRLQWWRARLSGKSQETGASIRLVPVTIRPTPARVSPSISIEVELRGGRQLRITGPFDPDLIVRFVCALESTGC